MDARVEIVIAFSDKEVAQKAHMKDRDARATARDLLAFNVRHRIYLRRTELDAEFFLSVL